METTLRRMILYVLLLAGSAQAVPRSEADIRAAVQTWVRHLTASARPDASVARMEPYFSGPRLVGYIAHLSGGGFCLCGADDQLLPVYVYNPADAYDPACPSHQYVLTRMAEYLDSLSAQPKKPAVGMVAEVRDFAGRASYWDQLASGQVPAAAPARLLAGADPAQMILPMTSRWHQKQPYNAQCPSLTGAEQTIVGCVATALAQILRYWQWPPVGEGNQMMPYWVRWQTTWIEEPLATDPNIPANWGGGGRLEWTSANGGRLRMNGFWDESVWGAAWRHSANASYRAALQTLYDRTGPNGMNRTEPEQYADFASTTYRWDLMHDSPASPPDAGDAAAALLSYHAGISVYMHWGIWGSASWDPHPQNAYVDHWRCAPGVLWENRSIERMTEEIQWFRPVQLGGSGPQGAHAWVVLGYDKATDPNRLFLMNIGWQGTQYEWHTCDTFFPDSQTHYTRIAPRDVVRFVGNTVTGDGSPASPHKNLVEALGGAPNGATLIFRAGSVHSISAPVVINQHVTLKGYNVVIQ